MPAETYTGKPCQHGHGTQRYRSNRHCVTCCRTVKDRLREDPIYRALDQLRSRRCKALKRMAQRNERRRTNG